MIETDEMICITCPMGCTVHYTHEGDTVLTVDGNTCPRGERYIRNELKDPRRMVATTVRVAGGIHPLVPVYTGNPFPKPRIRELLKALREIQINAPVNAAQVVLADALGTGIDIIASRDMPADHHEGV